MTGFLIHNNSAGINGSFSDWSQVTSGVPQRSVFGMQLFTTYINYLDEGRENVLGPTGKF